MLTIAFFPKILCHFAECMHLLTFFHSFFFFCWCVHCPFHFQDVEELRSALLEAVRTKSARVNLSSPDTFHLFALQDVSSWHLSENLARKSLSLSAAESPLFLIFSLLLLLSLSLSHKLAFR